MSIQSNNKEVEQALLAKLEEQPDSWEIRKQAVTHLYEDKQYLKAADILWTAPEIPSTDVDIAFALQIISRAKPNRSLRLIYEVLRRNNKKPLKNIAMARALNDVGLYMEASRFYGAAVADDLELFNLTFERQMLWMDDSKRLVEEWMKSDPDARIPLKVKAQVMEGALIRPVDIDSEIDAIPEEEENPSPVQEVVPQLPLEASELDTSVENEKLNEQEFSAPLNLDKAVVMANNSLLAATEAQKLKKSVSPPMSAPAVRDLRTLNAETENSKPQLLIPEVKQESPSLLIPKVENPDEDKDLEDSLPEEDTAQLPIVEENPSEQENSEMKVEVKEPEEVVDVVPEVDIAQLPAADDNVPEEELEGELEENIEDGILEEDIARLPAADESVPEQENSEEQSEEGLKTPIFGLPKKSTASMNLPNFGRGKR